MTVLGVGAWSGSGPTSTAWATEADSPATEGLVTSVVGTVEGESSPKFGGPFGVVVGPDNALYVCETTAHRISRVDLDTGRRTTVVGTGEAGFDGDGGVATSARVDEPYEIAFDSDGNLHFVDMKAHVVRRIDRRSGLISTVAGTGTAGFAGDGGPATRAQLRQPHSITFLPDGGLLICDIGNHRIRRVDPAHGTIATWAGTGEKSRTPDGSPRATTPLNGPRAIFVGPGPGRGGAGGSSEPTLYLALREGNAIFRLDGATDTWVHLGGTGKSGYTGDGGDAKTAQLAGPKGLAVDAAGHIFLADTESHTVRRIDATTGVITTVVGDGKSGDGPDGPALRCRLARPHGVGLGPDGTLYIGDSNNDRVRKLVPGGVASAP